MRQQKIPEQDFSWLHKGSYYINKKGLPLEIIFAMLSDTSIWNFLVDISNFWHGKPSKNDRKMYKYKYKAQNVNKNLDWK